MSDVFEIKVLIKAVISELKSKFLWFSAAFVIIIALCFAYKKVSLPYYGARGVVMVKSMTHEETNMVLSGFVQLLENEDYKLLEEQTGFPVEVLREIKEVHLELAEEVLTIDVEVYNAEVLRSFDTILINYIRSGDYYKTIVERTKRQNERLIDDIMKEMEVWNSGKFAQSNDDSPILLEKTFAGLMEAKVKINQLRFAIEDAQEITFLDPIEYSKKNRKEGYVFYAFVGTFLWLILMFTYFFFYLLFFDPEAYAMK